MSDSAAAHRRQAEDSGGSAGCAILTVSDTRTVENDVSGDLIAAALAGAGHDVRDRALTADDPAGIRARLEQWLADPAVEVVLVTGGTGVSRRDTTVEVVRGLIAMELEGFGELFRMISHRRIGAAAMLSRAVAGLAVRPAASGGDTFIFALPGSPHAVETALNELILPELSHLISLRRVAEK